MSDREYELHAMFNTPSAIYGTPGDTPVIYADNSARAVKSRLGNWGRVRGFTWYSGTSDTSFTVAANGGGSVRKDLVVLRLTRSTWNVRVAVVTGGSSLPAPVQDLGDTGVWELPLAQVNVAPGAATIAASDVTWFAQYVAPPAVVCKRDSRPAHAAGLIIYETDTQRLLVSNGSTWLIIRSDSGWLPVSAAGGWSVIQSKIRAVNGVASLQLSVNRTGGLVTATGISTLANIPTPYLPTEQVQILMYLTHGNLGHGYIDVDGSVVLNDFWIDIPTGTGVALHSVSWPVG
jgi:hypothetical protein